MKTVCQICRSTEWLDLPNPVATHAVTTTGRIINDPLGKAQCFHCGFTQRIYAHFLGLTDYYESDYVSYYDRPGATRFHAARYRVLAEWMHSVLTPLKPSTILDVGCGQGWGMEAMKALYPEAQIEGLDPSSYNKSVAQQKGFTVYEGRIGEGAVPPGRYDVVYSNNVIQHVTDVRDFLRSAKQMLHENGVMLITCPDASVPNIEVLWADQNFSFLPAHLIRVSREIGFRGIRWLPSPDSTSLPPAQMLFLSDKPLSSNGRSEGEIPVVNLEEIYRSKSRYLNSFPQIEKYLCSEIRKWRRTFNFGASYWSSILAAYCPRYWNEVSACLVDESVSSQRFVDKDVFEFASVEPRDDHGIVLGTNPRTHAALRKKLNQSWKQVVSWDSFAVKV